MHFSHNRENLNILIVFVYVKACVDVILCTRVTENSVIGCIWKSKTDVSV